MHNESLIQLVDELVHNPKARQELMGSGNLSSTQINKGELKALKKVFSQHSLISAALVTSVVPAYYWA